jgi:hypothetical protein
MPYAETREYAHELIDRIAPSQVPTVVGLLETMLDPVSLAVASAPYEDEVLTDGAKQALAKAANWSEQNDALPHEIVLAELGISQEEIDQYSGPK